MGDEPPGRESLSVYTPRRIHAVLDVHVVIAPGSAEREFGRCLRKLLRNYFDNL